MTFLAAASNPVMLLLGLVGCIPGWILPNFFLAGRVKKRQSDTMKRAACNYRLAQLLKLVLV